MNVLRAINKKNEKKKKQEKRKHASVSSVPDSFSGGGGGGMASGNSITGIPYSSVGGPLLSGAGHHHSTSTVCIKESPTHNILHVQTPPRRDSGPSPSHHSYQEPWASKVNGSSTPTFGTPVSAPKVSVGFAQFTDESQATRDREDVISITKDVQKFLATISQLKKAMEVIDTTSNTSDSNIRILEDKCSSAEPEDDEEDADTEQDGDYEEKLKEEKPEDNDVVEGEEEDGVREKLKELIRIVEVCLMSNQGMQSTELTRASTNLLKTYQECTHNNEPVSDCSQCNEAIDILVDTFTRCVSDYLTGETSDPSGLGAMLSGGGGAKARPQALGLQMGKALQLSKSHDNLARFSSSADLTQANEPIVDTIDQALSTIENSVEVASSYLKFRQKYHREIVGYLSKRAQIEQRYYAQLGKVVRQTQAALSELHQQEECLPLYDVFRKSLDQDNRYAMNCNTTFNLQTGHKVLEHLECKIQECEKMRKDLIHNWVKERKKLLDAKSSMKNAKAKYIFYGQELARAKNQLSADPYGKQADRRKKEVSELEAKFQDSEQNYKLSIAHCNDCQYQVHATAQKSILCAFRRIIVGFDAALKAGLETYFQLQHNFFTTLPDPLDESLEEAREYEAGSEFLCFIEKRPHVSEELEDFHFEEFDPESEVWESGDDPTDITMGSTQPSEVSKGPQRSLSPTEFKPLIASALPLIRMETPSPKPTRESRPKSVVMIDPVETVTTKSNLQRRNSEKGKDYLSITMSPYQSPTPSVTDDVVLSKVARTHTFKRLRTPSRCRGCDTYVYFHGFECDICGLSCHRKCLSTLAIRCDTKKLPRKMNTFGVDFHEHLKATKRHIPIIVTKCINEIDERGLNTQGLYRISSAKSKMEKLCQLFEAGSERVDLSDLPPHLISSCLKLYFRQLPEPLLTFALYQEFLTFAKEATRYLPCDLSSTTKEKEFKARELLNKLKELIYTLPEQNQLTLARLMYHLNRVSSPEHVKTNCMPPSNIGIVFGPNLLQQREMVPSLELLANMSYQAKVVEIMAAHVHDIFNVSEEDLKLLENESVEEESNERLVGEEDTPQILNKPCNLLIDDDDNKRLSLTPFSTPPEQRKHNMEELHEVAKEFDLHHLCVGGGGGTGGGTGARLRVHSQPAMNLYPQASPLLLDSRNWTDKCEGGGAPAEDPSSLPGTSDDHSFSDSVFDSIKRRLRPHASAVTMENTLAPLLEKEDSADDGGTTSLPQIDNNIGSLVMLPSRRRAQSLTRNMLTTRLEEEVEEEEEEEVLDEIKGSCDNVFRKTNLDLGPVRRLFLSEGNLLQAASSDTKLSTSEDDNTMTSHSSLLKEDSNASFESGILKLVNSPTNDDPRSPDSLEGSLEYKPFQSPDVQALLLPSHPRPPSHRDNEATPPVRSLPRNFHRQPPSLPPVRQMSEGHIAVTKPVKSPHYFTIGSPPLSSPISIDKSMSVPSSSRGSFSEGFMEELSEVQEEETLRERRGKEEKSTVSVEEHDEKVMLRYDGNKNDTKSGQALSSSCPPSVRNSKRISCESTDEELPLPDESPSVGVARGNPFKLRLATSRDSGLSDSPDPQGDADSSSSSSSPHHGMISSRVLLDKLSQLEPRQHKPHPSPLVNASTPPKQTTDSVQSGSTGRHHRPHQKKSRVTRHVMRVMKSLDLDDPPILSPELAGGGGRDSAHREERLRMISPENICSPSEEEKGGGDWSLRRSKSHAEGVYPHLLEEEEEEVEDGKIVGGGFIISEGKIGRRRGSKHLPNNNDDRGLSKSIDTL